jgi:large subunit ribosomal protein L35
MPKMKSHSGAKKRFKVTASGKVKYAKAGRSHFLTEKSSSRKIKLRKGAYLQGKHAKNIKRMISK